MDNDVPGSYGDPAQWEEEIQRYEKMTERRNPPKGAVLAYGSSSIALWGARLKDDFAPLTMINRGFGGSNMNDALHFADRLVLPLRPRAIMYYCGGNDLDGQGMAPEVVFEHFERLLKRVWASLPGVRWYVLQLKIQPRRVGIRARMEDYNRRLEALCAGDDRLTCIDTVTPMLRADGSPRDELYVEDRIHLNREGYELWRDTIRPVMVERERMYEPVAT